MKHTQTQGQDTGLASLLEGTTPGPKLRLHEYGHALYGTRLDIRLPKGSPCPIVADLGPNEFSPCLEVQREFGRLLVERFDKFPALAASHCALVAALENCAEIMQRVYPRGLPVAIGRLCEERDWDTDLRNARKALSDARNLSAGMEGGRK